MYRKCGCWCVFKPWSAAQWYAWGDGAHVEMACVGILISYSEQAVWEVQPH